jgi:hypothetical protein
LRGEKWPQNCETGFGVYNRGAQTAKTLRTTLVNALTRTDRVVWLYVEGIDLFSGNGIPEDWNQAIVGARADMGMSN